MIAAKSHKKVIHAAAALIRRESDGSFLITQRYLDDFLGGLWEFPGGKRYKSESFERCVKREVKEEVGVVIQVGSRHRSVSFNYPDRTVHLSFYWARIERGIPKPLGCRSLKWVLPRDLMNFTFPPADSELILELTRPDRLFSNC